VRWELEWFSDGQPSCIRNIFTKDYSDLMIIIFQVTIDNVGDSFLKHSVCCCCAELEDALVRTEEERVAVLRTAHIAGANQNAGSAGMPAVRSSQDCPTRQLLLVC